VAFDSGIDRLDSGVCERGGDKREGFAFFNITRLTSIFFKHLTFSLFSSFQPRLRDGVDIFLFCLLGGFWGPPRSLSKAVSRHFWPF
jgi:hypothetical protein